MMFLQFFSVIMASAINDAYVVHIEEIKKLYLDKFINKWCDFDKEVNIFLFKFD